MIGRRTLAYARPRRAPKLQASEIPHALPQRGTVVAVCACDGYDVSRLEASLGRQVSPPSARDAVLVHMSASEKDSEGVSHAYVFENGVVVAWGAPDVDAGMVGIRSLSKALEPYVRQSISAPLYSPSPSEQGSTVAEHSAIGHGGARQSLDTANQPLDHRGGAIDTSDCRVETLDYERLVGDEHSVALSGDTVVLRGPADSSANAAASEDERLMAAVSHGLADSVRLAMLEARLERIVAATRSLPNLLARGSRLPLSRSDVLRLTGALLACRAELGAAAAADVGTGATPDRYWCEPGLAEAYGRVSRCLDMRPRVAALTRQLDHADALAGVLRMHLSERHGLKLEWGIIALIAVEVFFEVLHFIGPK